MKKFCTLLILFCLIPACASAQWYLFPGKKKQNNPKTAVRDTVPVRIRPDSTALPPVFDSISTGLADSLQTVPGIVEDVFVLDIPEVVHIGLALPLQASGTKASENFLDFYSGALLALRDLGATGLKADLQVFDTADGKIAAPASLYTANDVIIGPVTLQDIRQALPQCGPDTYLVSPLDPKAADLAADAHIVQSPTPWTAQMDELVRWVQQDRLPGEELYVVRDTAVAAPGEQSVYLLSRLQESGIPFRSVSAANRIPYPEDGKVRVLIASDRDNFITGTVRSLSIEGARNNNVILYGTTRVRTNGTGQADLHNTNAHLASAYFIDYEDPAVERFILAYRSLFQNEPGSFAFQGYDTMHYYVSMCTRFGRQWYKKLPDYREKGLQSDFLFTEAQPRVNQAVRRVVYRPDLTTVLEK
ncbi:MAG: hypothetical protein IJV37_02680 [Bacteroidales bacterium]|nr:hypothetical protein [Bacteroidales bacterium]